MNNVTITVSIVTLSDKGSIGEREDESGRVIREIVERNGFTISSYSLLPDDIEKITHELIRLCDEIKPAFILTTGGTGFSPRDITPEATTAVCTRMANGISEAMRAHSLQYTKKSMLSRGVSGIRGNTIIVNMPGSPKAVRECLEYIIDTMPHAAGILRKTESECGRA